MDVIYPDLFNTQNMLPTDLTLWLSVDRGPGAWEPCGLTPDSSHPTGQDVINDPQDSHEQLHEAGIFIQGFNLVHVVFGERKVKDLE